MSELKARFIDDTYVEYYNTGKHELAQIYLKSETDKLLAELEESHKREVEQLLMEIVELKKACNDKDDWCLHTLKENRHSNYKRCLAMTKEWRSYAAFCGIQSSWHNNRGFGKTAEKWTWKECHAWRCVKRWMELAKKFKETK